MCLLEATASLHYKAIKSQTGSSGGRLPLPTGRAACGIQNVPNSQVCPDIPLSGKTCHFYNRYGAKFYNSPAPTTARSQVCVRAPLLRLEAKSPLTTPHPPNHRFLFESTLLLSERYYLFYRINEVKLLYEFVCDVSFLLQAGAAGKEPLLHVLMTVLILYYSLFVSLA